MRIVLGLSPTPHPTDETEGRKHGEVEIERWATNKKEKKRGRERKERENIESGSFFFRHFSMPNVECPFIEIAERPLFRDWPLYGLLHPHLAF